mgnify:CR=1 FL=1
MSACVLKKGDHVRLAVDFQYLGESRMWIYTVRRVQPSGLHQSGFRVTANKVGKHLGHTCSLSVDAGWFEKIEEVQS